MTTHQSEIIHKQNDHGMCEVLLLNGCKCHMHQDGIEYIVELETKVKELETKLARYEKPTSWIE